MRSERVQDLEQRVIDHLAADQEPWQTFIELDDVLTAIASTADHRLTFQSAYPITV